MKNNYSIGKGLATWSNGETQNITFIVTEDCNLRCKYCYITHKASNKKMNFEVAKKFIDYLISDKLSKSDCIIIEFIGGEPLLEIDLIDKISDYFKLKSFLNGHKWYWNYRINICTNGVNYNDEMVQKYFKKNEGKLSVSITLDGTQEKHDLQRVFPNGQGSYDHIIKNIPYWISKFNPGTKVTFSSDDLKYLKDSIINLWNLGIKEVAANVVFENVWKDNDDIVFEKQLKELADYILKNNLYNSEYKCTLFDEQIGYQNTIGEKEKTYCGAGKMLAVGPDGTIYPCLRYKDYSLNHNKEWIFGSVEKGIDMEKVRPFLLATLKLQSDSECLNCEVASGCAYCQGFNYDESSSSTNFYRAKYICKMHKARVRANNYYFSKLYNNYNITKEVNRGDIKNLYFLLDSQFITFCQNEKKSFRFEKMDNQLILDGLKYASENFFDITFIHSKDNFSYIEETEYSNYLIHHIIPIKFYKEANKLKKVTWVIEKSTVETSFNLINNCILNISENDICNLMFYINKIYNKVKRININIINITPNFDLILYKQQLIELKDLIKKLYSNTGFFLEVNVLTDLLLINVHDNCKAGETSFTLGADKNLYVCPASYSEGSGNKIGSLDFGLINHKDSHLYKNEFRPLCTLCTSYQCVNCVYLNKLSTNEVNVAPSYQCKKAHIEQEVAFALRNELEENESYQEIALPSCYDPIIQLMNKENFSKGIYKIENI